MKIMNTLFSSAATCGNEDLVVLNAVMSSTKSITTNEATFIVNELFPTIEIEKYLYVTPTTTWLSPVYNNGNFDIYSNVDWVINEE